MDIGDKVVLEGDEEVPGNWEGLTGVVIAESTKLDGETEWVRVKPDSDRPDGFGREWFFWPTSLMKKAD